MTTCAEFNSIRSGNPVVQEDVTDTGSSFGFKRAIIFGYNVLESYPLGEFNVICWAHSVELDVTCYDVRIG